MCERKELLQAFYDELKKAVYDETGKLSEKLIENNPEEYAAGVSDCGYYNNGVGFVRIDPEQEYDEDKTFDDALQEIAVDVANEGCNYDFNQKFFVENNKITEILAKLIKTM